MRLKSGSKNLTKKMRRVYKALHVDILHIQARLQGGPKIDTICFYALTLPTIIRLSKLFHFQNQEKIFNNTITKDPTTPRVCCYTTL